MSFLTKPRLIMIVGPTGIGKTGMAVKLASEWGGEIVSADSMQVHRLMDIGTAKPSSEERGKVRHHLIDVIDPDGSFNASMFQQMAGDVIETLQTGNKPVFVVGGTGLYIRTLLGGIVDGPGPDEGLRDYYRQEMERYGKAHIYNMLKEKDPAAAARINRNDAVRMIRALEVLELTGESIMNMQQKHGFSERKYESIKIGLSLDRERLNERLDRRVEGMIEAGFVEEVRQLLDQGYHEDLKSMKSLGYRHMTAFIQGVYPLNEAVRLMKRDTKRYAKRQMTWFGADSDIEWISPDDIDVAKQRISQFLRGDEPSSFETFSSS
jgi:tRNA dimethylallyltransferase